MRSYLVSLSLAPMLLAAPLLAQEAVPGADIAALIGGMTVQGSMSDTGAYAEFYDADGTIRGDGYTGTWTVEGDAMCFRYGEDPATCYEVAVEGEEVAWLSDGEVRGDGTLVEGNPNEY